MITEVRLSRLKMLSAAGEPAMSSSSPSIPVWRKSFPTINNYADIHTNEQPEITMRRDQSNLGTYEHRSPGLGIPRQLGHPMSGRGDVIVWITVTEKGWSNTQGRPPDPSLFQYRRRLQIQIPKFVPLSITQPGGHHTLEHQDEKPKKRNQSEIADVPDDGKTTPEIARWMSAHCADDMSDTIVVEPQLRPRVAKKQRCSSA